MQIGLSVYSNNLSDDVFVIHMDVVGDKRVSYVEAD